MPQDNIVQLDEKRTPQFTYELGEQDGHPVINDEEATAFVAYATGLTVDQVRAVQAADFEYLKRCGLVHE